MGGYVLETDLDRAMNEGIKIGENNGRAQGQKEGRKKTYYELVESGDLTAERAAEKLGVSVEQLKKEMTECGYTLL